MYKTNAKKLITIDKNYFTIYYYYYNYDMTSWFFYFLVLSKQFSSFLVYG